VAAALSPDCSATGAELCGSRGLHTKDTDETGSVADIVTDEYEHDDDCGYVRFEVTNTAAFVVQQLVDSPGGLVAEQSKAVTGAKAASVPQPLTPSPGRSGSRLSSCSSLEAPDTGEWNAVDAAHLDGGSVDKIQPDELELTTSRDPLRADVMLAVVRESATGANEQGPDGAADNATQRRNAAMQRFFQAQEQSQTADADANAADSSMNDVNRDAGAEGGSAIAKMVPTSPLLNHGSPTPLEGIGGFTFSPPVGVPSPPMSLAGFSFRSATSGSDAGEDECDEDDRHSETSIGRHSAIDLMPTASLLPPLDRDSPVERRSSPSSADRNGGDASPAPAAPAAASSARSPSGLGGTSGTEDDGLEAFELRVVAARRRTGFEAEKDFPITLGSVVAGRYQITEYLGSAAFSRAVQAHDLQTGALVCLKIIKNSKDFFDQSLDEIKLLKLLNAADPGDEHGVLRMFDSFYYKEHLFIATELLRANLYEFQRHTLESGEPHYFTAARLRRIARQVLQALAFVHAQGILHCDLKPENILFRSFSRCVVKVIDFGSSCFMGDHPSSYVQSRSYRAPEVILGAVYDFRIDIWSVGCIMAELHTGRVLFQNDSLASLLARVVGICGPLPPRLLAARHAHKYFTRSGDVYERDPDTGACFVLRPKACRLHHRLSAPDGSQPDAGFVDFVAWLLTQDPEARPTAQEALTHPWLNDIPEDASEAAALAEGLTA